MEEIYNRRTQTNTEIIRSLGKRFREYRLALRLTQAEVSERSGVSLPTIKRFELGLTYNITMGNFISLLKAIGYESEMEQLLPPIPLSPYIQAKIEAKKPKRIRHGKQSGNFFPK